MKFDARALAFAVDERGIPVCGRQGELDALAAVGYEDLPRARLFEGHVNALELVARVGTAAQREGAAGDAAAGLLFGVWNTQDGSPVRLLENGAGLHVSGSKTFASGAGTVARALITAAREDGRSQLVLARMETLATPVDRAAWRPLGMERSDSFAIAFDDAAIERTDLIGPPGSYESQPWFFGGSLRFIAAQTGALVRLRDELFTYLKDLGRGGDAFQQQRIAEVAIGVETAQHWIAAGARAWTRFDERGDKDSAEEVLRIADMARVVVERQAFDIAERVQRSVGARGLLEPYPFPRLLRDLFMYIRQPGPDVAIVRIAERALSQQR